ncbi:MAG TPA: cytochrome c3 family protein [Terracidiphilus sp.]|nr:cytochrome c3 family protein [Terracidiphilus sp.]
MKLLRHSILFSKAPAKREDCRSGRRGSCRWWIGSQIACWVCLALLAGMAARASAAVHPVPLDKNTDPKKCLECHDDKTKHKFVHSAMDAGCMGCHEIRTNKDVTRVKLITATPSALCLTCHADKDAKTIKGTVHPPAVRDCLACHDPHSSDNKNQLVKAESGDAKENLCLSCHQTGLHASDKGSRHAALDAGCDTCHTTHKTGPEPTTENRFHLAKAAPALCVDCHDTKDADLEKAHNNQPFGTANCVQCHDPHQSDSPKLMAKFQHVPFQGNGCDACHQPAKDGKVVLTETDAKALCVTCHDDKAKMIDSAKVQHPGAGGDCTDCHNPHASSQPGLPKSDSVSMCLGCHSDIDELRKKSVHHQPAFAQGCATCHTPHGGDNDHLLRAKGNSLCLECHGPDSAPKRDEANHLLTIFNGSVRLPDDYYKKNKVPILPLRYGLGHPVEYHPVSDVMDPANQSKVKTPLSCLSCHQPHASAQPDLLANDQVNNMAFCDTCHKNRLNMKETTLSGK